MARIEDLNAQVLASKSNAHICCNVRLGEENADKEERVNASGLLSKD